MPVRRTARSRRGSQPATSGPQQHYDRSPDLPTQCSTASPCPSKDLASFPLNRSPLFDASTASQIPYTQVAGDASSDWSVPHSPCPAVVNPEEIEDDLGRDAYSVGHGKLHLKKGPLSKRIACEDTNVVSVNERSKRDLTKCFDEMDVDWFLVERQLSQWRESFCAGKKLGVDVSFNYVEIGQPAPVAPKRAGKRGYPSSTQQMLAERDSQVDAEEGTSSQPSIWQDLYNLM
jgi:hypothetical protein